MRVRLEMDGDGEVYEVVDARGNVVERHRVRDHGDDRLEARAYARARARTLAQGSGGGGSAA